MKKYYAERSGQLDTPLNLSLYELNQAFFAVYKYFRSKGSFDIAFKGIYEEDPDSHSRIQLTPPSMSPSPEVYFMVHLQDKQAWPIEGCYENYPEEILFSVIEMLYDHIGVYNFKKETIEKELEQNAFAEQINNLLKAYKDGYYLEPTCGYIMGLPNLALKEQLAYTGEEMPEGVFAQLQSASCMYYRFDADMEAKKKAINILADILENVREELKNILNSEFEVAKNEHDKLIFGIVNTFNIRHNKADQKGDYHRNIWYEWMMQYYTSVIITYYRLNKAINNKEK